MRRPGAKASKKRFGVKGQRRQRSILLSKEALILFFVLAIAGTWKFIFHEAFHDTTPASIFTSEWNRYTPGGTALSLLLPAEPNPESSGIPEVTGNAIKHAQRYQLSIEKFHVAVWNVTYADGVPTDIQRAADGAAETVKQSKGVTDYQDKRRPIVRSGKAGVLTNARLVRDGEKLHMAAALLGEKERLWQVIVTHPVADRNGALASKKILDSIQIQ